MAFSAAVAVAFMYSSGVLFSLLLSFSIQTQIFKCDEHEFFSVATKRLIFVVLSKIPPQLLDKLSLNVEKTLIFTDTVSVFFYLSMSSVFYAIFFVFLSLSHKRDFDITETNSLKDILGISTSHRCALGA